MIYIVWWWGLLISVKRLTTQPTETMQWTQLIYLNCGRDRSLVQKCHLQCSKFIHVVKYIYTQFIYMVVVGIHTANWTHTLNAWCWGQFA